MTRSKAKTFLEDASRNERFSGRAGVRQDGQKCLVCGACIGGGEPTFHVRGVVVHMRCAVYGRRLVGR